MLRPLLHLLRVMSLKATTGNSYQTMLPTHIRGLKEIYSRYDLFLFDQFGVLHDGRAPLPYALDTLRQLHDRHKRVVVLSNSSNRAEKALQRLHHMGFTSVENILTSGELAWSHLSLGFRGRRCCWVTWAGFRTDPFLSDLEITTSGIDDADFLLLHGSQVIVGAGSEVTPLEFMSSGVIEASLEAVLKRAVQRNIPVVCANMDLTAVLASGQLAYMPGTLLNRYQQMGGTFFTSFGKPQLQFFEAALDMGHGVASNTLHVGDSLLHDIAGATSANIDSLLVTKHGVHKMELHSLVGDRETPLLTRVCDETDRLATPRPTFVIENLLF